MARLSTAGLVTQLKRTLGAAIEADVFDPLALEAARDAIRTLWPDYRELVIQDLVGTGAVYRFELMGRNVALLPPDKQDPPIGIAAFVAMAAYDPYSEDIEQEIGADGNPKPGYATIVFNELIPLSTKVRVRFTRRIEIPSSETTIIPVDEEVLLRKAHRYVHEYLSAAQIAGDASAHAYLAGKIDQGLDMDRRRSGGYKNVQFKSNAWRP